MKPLVYFIDKKNNNNEILIDKDELLEMLNEVYQAGFYDGQSYKCNMFSSTTPYTILNDINYKDKNCINDNTSIQPNNYGFSVQGVANKITSTISSIDLKNK